VLFTNYQFYIDEFVRLGLEEMRKPDSEYIAFVEPGNVVTRRTGLPAEPADALGTPPPRLPQMPAYHLVRAGHAGITMVNIGVGPSNAKTITDHIAVLRPHAWMMLGHCAGLRNSQQLGDYVLAHAYVREDHVLDEELPLWVPIPALAEMQLALEQAVEDVTQVRGADLKRVMRTGTVASTDNRNWELLPHNEPQRRFSAEPRGGAGHGERHHCRQRLSLPRALRHPAVRERQALHGEIKLPGMANQFYRERVDQHLRIGMRAIEMLQFAAAWTGCTAASCAASRSGVSVGKRLRPCVA
jgi:AMP nucleosidase